MKDDDKTKEQLIYELKEIREQLSSSEYKNRNEMKLQESEERVSSTFNAISDTVLLHHLREKGFSPFIEVNDTACRRYGYSREEFKKLTVADITMKTDAQLHTEQKQRNKSDKKKNMIFDSVHFTKSGEKFPVEINSSVIKIDGRKVILSVIRDISERKKVEKSLLITQFSYDKAAIGIYQIESGGRIINVNDEAVRMLGYSIEEMEKLNITDIDSMLNSQIWEALWHSLTVKRTDQFETVQQRKDSSEVSVEINSKLLEFEGIQYAIVFSQDISKRKKTEKILQENIIKLQTIYNTLPVIIWSTNREGIFTLSEGKELQALGLTSGELLGKSVFDVYKENPIIIEKMKTCLKGRSCEYDVQVGESIYNSVLTPIYDENEKILGSNGLAIDVTEKRRVENELKHGAERLIKLNYIKEDLLMTGGLNEKIKRITDSVVDMFNADFARIWLVKPGDLCSSSCKFAGMTAGENNCPDHNNCLHLIASSGSYTDIEKSEHRRIPIGKYKIGRLAASKGPGFFTNDVLNDPLIHNKEWAGKLNMASFAGYRLKSHDNETIGIIAFFSKSHLTNNDEAMFQAIAGTSSEVILASKADDNIRHLRNYLSNIINSMPSALVGVDSDGRVTQWNSTVEENTGITAEDAQGEVLSSLLPQMSLEMKKISKSIQSRQVFQEQKRSNTINKNAVYEDMTIYPLITNGVNGAVIRIDDVTDKVRMEEMMVQSEKMLSVGGLAAGMAHEINNPLAGMLQTASVLSRRIQNNPDIPANKKAAEELGTNMQVIEKFMEARGIPRMIQIIKESGKRVADIVDNMLSFSKKSEAIVSSHNLNSLLDKTLELAETEYNLKKNQDFKKIKITREYATDLIIVPCVGGKIQQVLLNLFRNGAQAMQGAGTENPEFIIRTFNDMNRNMVCLEVEDNGPGMEEDVRKRIFEPFFTTKVEGGGTGLGLSVSYFIIVENHSGEMEVESEPGSGTKFSIRIPLERRKSGY
jgi:PAS domain S-box-containing protein